MKNYFFTIIPLFLILFITTESRCQNKVKPWLNAGYITNLKKCDDCKKSDSGGSVRLGLLTRGKFGFYAGYAWFNEFHKDYIEYDDSGWLLIGGVDFLLLTEGSFKVYGKLGIGLEKFISTYTYKTEAETSIKPDFGLFFNFMYLNAYAGWMPSEPSHINLGVGITLWGKRKKYIDTDSIGI